MNRDAARKYLFVGGVARSGTTALTNCLGQHHEIVLGMERFKYLLGTQTITQFVPACFERDAFFDLADGHTNLTPDHAEHGPFITRFYERMRHKFDAAAYVGDKVPSNFRFMEQIHSQFSPMRMVFIFRDVREVALSWGVRAADRDDTTWAVDNGAVQGVRTWNEAISSYEAFDRRHPGAVLPIEHRRFFGNEDGTGAELHRILEFLELEIDDGVTTGYRNANNNYRVKVVDKPRRLSRKLDRYIRKHADLAGLDRILSAST